METNLSKLLEGSYKAEQAIIVYKWDGNYYLESHQIKDGKLLQGSPLSEDSIADVVEFFSVSQHQKTHISGIVPDNLLLCNWSVENQILIWYQLPQEQQMFFSESLHIPSGVAHQPGLIFVSKNSSLSVFAYKGTGRPTMDTLLYSPPYHNCGREGSVCLGGAQLKKPKDITYSNMIKYRETLFWNTKFTHITGTSPMKGNINSYWKKAIESNMPFDNDQLLPTKITFKQLIEKF